MWKPKVVEGLLLPFQQQGGQVSVGGRDAILNQQMSGSIVGPVRLLEDICDLTEPENQGMLGEDGIWTGNLRQGAGWRSSADPYPKTLLGNKWPLITGFANERAERANTVQVEIFLQLGAQRMQDTPWGFQACLGETFLFAQVGKGRGAHRLHPELLSRNHSRDGGLLMSLFLSPQGGKRHVVEQVCPWWSREPTVGLRCGAQGTGKLRISNKLIFLHGKWHNPSHLHNELLRDDNFKNRSKGIFVN